MTILLSAIFRAYSKHALISSISSKGNAVKMFFTDSPAAKYSRMVDTDILIPLITGFPLQISGFVVILHNVYILLYKKIYFAIIVYKS